MNSHQTFQFGATCVAVSFNVFLLFLILKYSSDKIGSYKYFLFAYTLNSVFYSCSQFFLLENWYIPTRRAGYLFFSTVGIFSKTVHTWILFLFIGLFHMNLFIVCWSFLYRLTVFSQSFFFRKWSNIIILGIFTLFCEVFTIFDGWLIRPTEQSDEEYRDIILNVTGRPIEDVGYIGGAFMYDDGVNVNQAVSLSINGGLNAAVNAFIIYAWCGIRARLAEKKRLASSTLRLHYRLYILLTIQSVCPIIFNSTPVILAFSFSALHINIGDYLLLCGDAMNIAQVVDPLCIIFLVTDYRRALLKLILGKTIYRNHIDPTSQSFNNSQSRPAESFTKASTVLPPIRNPPRNM